MTMKRVLIILLNLLAVTAMAQTKGRFEVHGLGNFKLHVYYTNDALGGCKLHHGGQEGARDPRATLVQGQRGGV